MKVYEGKSPCWGCAKRMQNCHPTCKDYNDWVATGVEPEQPTFYKAKRFSKTGNSVQKKPK